MQTLIDVSDDPRYRGQRQSKYLDYDHHQPDRRCVETVTEREPALPDGGTIDTSDFLGRSGSPRRG
jgi:hypothetical protein